MKCIYKFANPHNATVTDSPQLLTPSFSLRIEDSKGKNSN